MNNKPEGPPKGPSRGPDTPAPKRPFATIDATATEVKSAQGAPGAAKPGAPGPASAGGTPPQAEAAAKVAAAAASVGKPAAAASTATAAARSAGATDDKPAASSASAARSSGATPPPPSAARSGSGLGRLVSHTAAGIVGGLAVLAGAPHVPQLQSLIGITPPSATSIPPDLARRFEALEQNVRSRPAAALPEEAARRLTALENSLGQVGEVSKAVGGAVQTQTRLAEETKALRDMLSAQGRGADAERLAKLEERLSALSAAALAEPERAGRIPQLVQITGKIADLENALTNRLAAVRRDMVQEIEARIATTAEASETARSGSQRLDREVTALKSETTRVGQRVEQLKTAADRVGETLRAADEQRAALESALAAMKADMAGRFKEVARPADVATAVAPVSARVGKLESSIASVVSAEQDRRANAERIVLSLELANLKRAMDRGGRYAPELAEVRRISGGRLDLAALEKFQNDGVATMTELQRTFRPLTNAIIEADGDQPDASVVDRLLSGARTIVRVRRTAPDAADTSVEAMVARMESALQDGRLGDVLAHAKTMPERAIRPAKAWLAQVEARQAVETALATVERQLKANLGSAPAVAAPAAGAKGAKQ